MSIVQCTECKKEISDKATACPNCGALVEAPPRGFKVKISRIRKNKHEDWKINIEVDGAVVACASNGEVLVIDMSAGRHKIRFLQGGAISEFIDVVNPTNGNIICIECWVRPNGSLMYEVEGNPINVSQEIKQNTTHGKSGIGSLSAFLVISVILFLLFAVRITFTVWIVG